MSQQQIEEQLSNLQGWAQVGEAIEKEFVFADFAQAFGFMAAVAIKADKLGHHPDWSNTYNKVSVRLSTHDEGGISELDFKLAAKMDQLAKQ